MKKEVAEKTKKNRKLARTILPIAFLVGWVFVSVVASQYIVGLAMIGILGRESFSSPAVVSVYSFIYYLISLILIIFVPLAFVKKWRTDREELGLMELPTWTDIGLAPVGFIVATLLAVGLTSFFSIFPWFNASEVQETGFSIYMSGQERIFAFLSLVVLAPIVEEIVFRGFLYGKLRAKLSMPLSILITSLLFAILHFQWNVGVNVFALSVVLCVLREITGTVYAGILTHMVKNGVAFYLLYVLHMI